MVEDLGPKRRAFRDRPEVDLICFLLFFLLPFSFRSQPTGPLTRQSQIFVRFTGMTFRRYVKIRPSTSRVGLGPSGRSGVETHTPATNLALNCSKQSLHSENQMTRDDKELGS